MKQSKQPQLAAKARITKLEGQVRELTETLTVANEKLRSASQALVQQRNALASCFDSLNSATGTVSALSEANKSLSDKVVMWRGISCILSMGFAVLFIKAVM